MKLNEQGQPDRRQAGNQKAGYDAAQAQTAQIEAKEYKNYT
ncbi:MAG: hypothetical protein ACLT0Y_03560 [Christensenellales bacterium]